MVRLTSTDGRVFVADGLNHRVQVFARGQVEEEEDDDEKDDDDSDEEDDDDDDDR